MANETLERLIEIFHEIDISIEEGNICVWNDDSAQLLEELKENIYKLHKELSSK